MNDRLHIVCLDAPAPPDYGGAIDMYHKIIALAAAGKKITLHYFSYKQGRDAGTLQSYCSVIHAYPRKGFGATLYSPLPFLVRSRINRELIDRLNADEDPVLLEGLHCAGLLPRLRKPERAVVRMHNEEASYYARLALTEKSLLKRAYLHYEAALLRRYYRRLPPDTPLACLSQTDMDLLSGRYGFRRVHFIPCFLPWQQLETSTGTGTYCLYHGNLSVPENEAAAVWLMREVWPHLQVPLVIAGKGASARLVKLCAEQPQVRLENDPSLRRINELVAGAQVHTLPSLNTTGVKLKLLHALFRGRFCITNPAGVMGSGIDAGVAVAEDGAAWARWIRQVFDQPFTEAEKKDRAALLAVYDNQLNAERLSALWTHYQ